MKTAISVPDPLFEAAETLAERLGVSRSALYARALREFIANRRKGAITQRLDVVYGQTPASAPLDPQLLRLQTVALGPGDEW